MADPSGSLEFQDSYSPFLLIQTSVIMLLLMLTSPATSFGQDYNEEFTEAMELYEEGMFTESAELFDAIEAPEARLFAGKSYFAASDYILAIDRLTDARQSGIPRVAADAGYTLALSYFQTKQYGRSLDLLHEIFSNPAIPAALRNDANRFYNQTLAWLSPAQRNLAFTHSQNRNVQRQLIESGIVNQPSDTGGTLLKVFAGFLDLSEDDPEYQEAAQLLERRILREERRQDLEMFPNAPAGMTFNIGVLLPGSGEGSGSESIEVSQGLYYGIMMAADEFNRQHSDKKIKLHYRDDSDAAGAFSDLVWLHHVDLIIGPLFSESVSEVAPLAEKYGIPVLAPLANSDELNRDYAYLYQTNPTFRARGKKMADFAVNRMGFRRLAILVEENSLGVEEALSFRDEAEKLGATIVYFFLENFEARAYDLSDFTIHFSDPDFLRNQDPELHASLNILPVDALYIPVTGQSAPTIINLVLTDLQANRSETVILGSEEFGLVDINQDMKQYFRLYYTESMSVSGEREEVVNYTADYRNRFGIDPNLFGYMGYDSANFIFKALGDIRNPDLLNYYTRFQPEHTGLSSVIHFEGTYVNQAIQIFRIEPSGNTKVY
jgi:tetratricopeptide (TPR) repeat protein